MVKVVAVIGELSIPQIGFQRNADRPLVLGLSEILVGRKIRIG
jgi:hypothetical protein